MSTDEKAGSSGAGCGALIWLLVVAAAFYGAGWSVGDRQAVATAQTAKVEPSGNNALQAPVNSEYQPPTSFAEQIKNYQIGVTAENGTEWYGVFATARFIDVGWWTWAPFFLLGLPIIVLIPMGSE